ncbi:MAG: hypothetical protein WCJ03_07215 [Bacteroidales bacterium]
MKNGFLVIKRLGYVHIHFDCATSHQAARIADTLNAKTSIYVTCFTFNIETQSVVVSGKANDDISAEYIEISLAELLEKQ